MKTRSLNFILALSIIAIVLFGGSIYAQDTAFRSPSIRLGAGIGYNNNMASLGYQNLHEPFPNFDKPDTDNEKVNGDGSGIHAGALFEYLSSSWWGVQIRASYEQRAAAVRDIFSSPNTEFVTRMDYLTFEPALRLDQHILPGLSFTAGPVIAANLSGTFDYKSDANGPITDMNIDVPDRSVVSLGASFGAAYDFEIRPSHSTLVYLSPYLDYSWIAAQRKSVTSATQNSVQDIWSTQTIRAGIRLSWGSERETPASFVAIQPTNTTNLAPSAATSTAKIFYAILPDGNMIVHKSVTGYFPVHPYVFFNKRDQSIPARYSSLTAEEATRFSTDDLGKFSKNDNTDKQININRLMEVYYNVLNIYGDRMRRDPSVTVTLRSSDPENWEARASANAVQTYLVQNFGIAPSRIMIDIDSPWSPSGSEKTNPDHMNMINDENRRVKLVFSDPAMYKAIPYTITDMAPFENDMHINIQNNMRFMHWSVLISGENQSLYAGPFRTRTAAIDLSTIMHGLREGVYRATVTMALLDGSTVSDYLDFKVYRSDVMKNATRYLMLFDYNDSKSVAVYKDILNEYILPRIASGDAVFVHGHTDIIGDEEGNLLLSQSRADDVRNIIVAELGEAKIDAKVIAVGIGQQHVQYTFDNSHPEGRMYNRNVFVDVVK